MTLVTCLRNSFAVFQQFFGIVKGRFCNLYAADDPDAALEQMEFKLYHGAWTRASGDYTLYVESEEVPTEAGSMWKGYVRAFYHNRNVEQVRPEDEELFALPCTRYREGEAQA